MAKNYAICAAAVFRPANFGSVARQCLDDGF